MKRSLLFMIFFDNMALDCEFLLEGEYFGCNFQTFLNAKEIKTFFDIIRNFHECRFSKNDIECNLEKFLLMLFYYFETFLENKTQK